MGLTRTPQLVFVAIVTLVVDRRQSVDAHFHLFVQRSAVKPNFEFPAKNHPLKSTHSGMVGGKPRFVLQIMFA